ALQSSCVALHGPPGPRIRAELARLFIELGARLQDLGAGLGEDCRGDRLDRLRRQPVLGHLGLHVHPLTPSTPPRRTFDITGSIARSWIPGVWRHGVEGSYSRGMPAARDEPLLRVSPFAVRIAGAG